MRKIQTLFLLALGCTSANSWAENASYPHIYVQAQVGYADVHDGRNEDKNEIYNRLQSLGQVAIHDEIDGKGLVGRAAAGFALNRNLAVEAGISAYPTADQYVHIREMGTQNYEKLSEFCDLYSLDVLARLSIGLPFSSNFFVFGAGGYALIYTHRSEVEQYWESGGQARLSPMVSGGVNYNFCSSLGLSASANHIFCKGTVTDRDYIPAITYVAAGLSLRI